MAWLGRKRRKILTNNISMERKTLFRSCGGKEMKRSCEKRGKTFRRWFPRFSTRQVVVGVFPSRECSLPFLALVDVLHGSTAVCVCVSVCARLEDGLMLWSETERQVFHPLGTYTSLLSPSMITTSITVNSRLLNGIGIIIIYSLKWRTKKRKENSFFLFARLKFFHVALACVGDGVLLFVISLMIRNELWHFYLFLSVLLLDPLLSDLVPFPSSFVVN